MVVIRKTAHVPMRRVSISLRARSAGIAAAASPARVSNVALRQFRVDLLVPRLS
jgi:hypothetical protein